jgi:hypothetical protein
MMILKRRRLNASFDAEDWNDIPKITLRDNEYPVGNGSLRLKEENWCLVDAKKGKELYYLKIKKKMKQKNTFLLVGREDVM